MILLYTFVAIGLIVLLPIYAIYFFGEIICSHYTVFHIPVTERFIVFSSFASVIHGSDSHSDVNETCLFAVICNFIYYIYQTWTKVTSNNCIENKMY